MNYRKIDYFIFYTLLSVSAAMLVYVSLFSKSHYEGSESIYHYFHSAAILDHPDVALNHWGKPLFIALSAPFTYFGVKGVMIFNSLVMLLSTYFSFKLGRRLGFKFAFPFCIRISKSINRLQRRIFVCGMNGISSMSNSVECLQSIVLRK